MNFSNPISAEPGGPTQSRRVNRRDGRRGSGECGGGRRYYLFAGHRLLLLTLFAVWLSSLAPGVHAQSNVTFLTREHTDFKILYAPGTTNVLSLMAHNADNNFNLASNEVILVCKSNAQLALPPGTPFGDGGQPFWILPQSQNVNLLYLGVSAEGIPAGVFNGPLSVQLKSLEGPGYFMVWQATGPGQFNIRVNTRDGISASDAFTPLTGSHEHFNWGFSSTGIYCATFQVVGQRVGEATNLTSPWTTFVFHVLPLPLATNFPIWQKQFWPPGFNPAISGSNASPDGDVFNNFLEYAFNLSPTNANALTNAPQFSFVTTNGQTFGALGFTRYLPARDLLFEPEVSGALPGNWLSLTNTFSVTPISNGVTERVTMRDFLPATNGVQRFFRLKTTLF